MARLLNMDVWDPVYTCYPSPTCRPRKEKAGTAETAAARHRERLTPQEKIVRQTVCTALRRFQPSQHQVCSALAVKAPMDAAARADFLNEKRTSGRVLRKNWNAKRQARTNSGKELSRPVLKVGARVAYVRFWRSQLQRKVGRILDVHVCNDVGRRKTARVIVIQPENGRPLAVPGNQCFSVTPFERLRMAVRHDRAAKKRTAMRRIAAKKRSAKRR